MRRKHITCTIDGCERPHKGRGMCNTHYQRWLQGYSIEGPIRSWHVGEWGPWGRSSDGYVQRQRRVDGRHEQQLQHRVVMEDLLGRALLPEESVHHINGVRDDNRPENLELWASTHPSGQRVKELLSWAREIVERYEGIVV